MPDTIPAVVERELGSDGEPTGRFVFIVDDLHRFYEPDYDPDRMEFLLEQAGYTYRQFRGIIRDLDAQFQALTPPPPKPAAARGKKSAPAEEPPPTEEPAPPDEPASTEEASAE